MRSKGAFAPPDNSAQALSAPENPAGVCSSSTDTASLATRDQIGCAEQLFGAHTSPWAPGKVHAPCW